MVSTQIDKEAIVPIHAHPCITSGSCPPHQCTSMHHISKLSLPHACIISGCNLPHTSTSMHHIRKQSSLYMNIYASHPTHAHTHKRITQGSCTLASRTPRFPQRYLWGDVCGMGEVCSVCNTYRLGKFQHVPSGKWIKTHWHVRTVVKGRDCSDHNGDISKTQTLAPEIRGDVTPFIACLLRIQSKCILQSTYKTLFGRFKIMFSVSRLWAKRVRNMDRAWPTPQKFF